MKVLSISTDRKIFEEGSTVFSRQLDYAEKMEELHIIVFSKCPSGLKEIHKGNLHIYETNSFSRLNYISDAKRLGKEIIKEKEIDLISTQDPFETGLVGYGLKKKFGLPLQMQIHTDFLSPYFKNSILNRIRVGIARFLISKADGLRMVSSVISDSIKLRFPSLKAKIDILPIWVDVEKFEKTAVVGGIMSPYTILVVSRLTKEKNINLAIDAFKKIPNDFSNDGLYIVGDGDQIEKLSGQIIELGLGDKVKIVGWENHDIIRSLYKTAKIFLNTSEYEGYGMTLVEAAAAGCPIVTTEVGIAKTNLFKNGENSFVCPVGDVDCLARSIINLLEHPEKRDLFKERMQDSIRKLMIPKEEYISKYISLLESLTKNDK